MHVHETVLVPLNAGDACTVGGELPCPPTTSCLGVPGAQTCTVATTLHVDDGCNANDTAHICPTDTLCLLDTDNTPRCVDGAARVCAAAVVAVPGANAGSFTGAFDGATPSCDTFGNVADEAFVYTIQGAHVKLTATATGTGNDELDVFVRAGVCGASDTDVACTEAGFNGPTTADVNDLRAGDIVTVFATDFLAGGGAFTLDLEELPIETLNEGDECVPGSDTATCDVGLACLGGPLPRISHCLTGPTVGNTAGDECVTGSTDELCNGGALLACIDDVCTTETAATSGSFSGTVTAASPTSNGRPGNTCAVQPGAAHFNSFGFSNTAAASATVTASTGAIGCGGTLDTVLGVYVPALDPTDLAGGTCRVANDDIVGGSGDFCSSVSFALAAGETADVVVWPFADVNLPLPYTLAWTSTQAVLAVTH
jgi:hypothetical protein